MNYLEISPRQVGKTHRLIRDMEDVLTSTPDGYVVLFSHNKITTNMMFSRSALLQRNRERIIEVYGIQSLRGICSQRDVYRHRDCLKVYYEEFDFSTQDKLNAMRESLQLFSCDWYACTTASRIRTVQDFENNPDDILLMLLERNNYQYVTHGNVKRLFENPGMLSDEQLNIEYNTHVFEKVNTKDKDK